MNAKIGRIAAASGWACHFIIQLRLNMRSMEVPWNSLRFAWLSLWGYRERPVEDFNGMFKSGHKFPRRRNLFEQCSGWWPFPHKVKRQPKSDGERG